MLCKNLRSPFKNSALCCFFTAFESHLYTHIKIKIPPDWVGFLFWLGCRDSNPGNVRVRVWCLTAWRHPNIFDFAIISHLFSFVKWFGNIFITFFNVNQFDFNFALFDKINTTILHVFHFLFLNFGCIMVIQSRLGLKKLWICVIIELIVR